MAAVTTLAAALAFMAPHAAQAEPSPALDRASISIGAFHADPELSGRVNTNFGLLDTGKLEPNKVTMPRIKADVLLFDSQGLSFDYYRYDRTYSDSFASNVNIGSGSVLTTGSASLDTQLDLAKLAYKWWLGSGDTVLGLGAGAAYYRIKLDANATADLGGGLTGAISDRYSDDAVAPLLEVGLRHQLTSTVRLFADASGIRKNGGSASGEIYNAALGVEWFPWKNVGLVLDYGVTKIEIERNDAANAQIKAKLRGPSAFLKVRF